MSVETIKGYLLRVAYENGYTSLRSLSNIIGQHIGSALTNSDYPEHKKLKKALKKHLCLTESEFQLCELKNTELVQLSNHIVDITDNRLKVCIECFKEAPVINKNWQAIHTTHCLKHNCKLVNDCPSCEKPLSDSTSLFEECRNCGLPWSNMSMLKSDLPTYQKIEERLSADNKLKFRAAFFHMLAFVTRPLDLHVAVYQRFPRFIKDADINKYFDYAYKMLANENFAKAMLENRRLHCVEHGKLTELVSSLSYFDEPILKAINSVALFITQKSFDKIPLPEALNNSKHYKNSERFSEDNYPFKIEHQNTAELLGIASNDLNLLVEEGIVENCEFVGVRKRKWFDIRTVDKNLQAIDQCVQHGNTSDKKWVNLYNLAPILQRYNLSFAKALKLVIENKLELIANKQNWKLKELCVCRTEAISYFENHFIETLSGPIAKRDIIEYFHFDGKQFTAFKSIFQDELIFENCSFGYIPGESIKHFFTNYILLNKQCKLQRANLKSSVIELRAAGVLPINSDAPNSKLYIYKKYPHIQAAIAAVTTRLSLR